MKKFNILSMSQNALLVILDIYKYKKHFQLMGAPGGLRAHHDGHVVGNQWYKPQVLYKYTKKSIIISICTRCWGVYVIDLMGRSNNINSLWPRVR